MKPALNAVRLWRVIKRIFDPPGSPQQFHPARWSWLSVRKEKGKGTMDPKIIIIIAVAYFYGFFEISMNLRLGRKSKVTTSSDKGSLWVLFSLITLGYALSFAIGATKTGRMHAWNAFFAIGMTLFVIGLMIRIHSLLTLKQYFTYSVAKVENHKIIETGLYKFIRHPGYLGQLMIFLGISTSISNWLSILVMLIPVTLGYLYRIKVEERFMLEQLGEDYLNYQERTKRLIPMIY
jgi:protein-S-isoprenylcysteine O-methyltransferase Ste14